MADIELPQPGEYPWSEKLNTALEELNQDVENKAYRAEVFDKESADARFLRSVNGFHPDANGNVQVSGGGGGGTTGLQMIVEVPLATWVYTFPYNLGRMPSVSIFLGTGEAVEADIHATPSAVSVSFPSPETGWLIIT